MRISDWSSDVCSSDLDDLVDARAERLRKAAVAQGRGIGAVVAEELVPDPVELVGGDARRDVAAHLFSGLGAEPAGDPHLLDRLGVLDLIAGERRGRGLVDILRADDRGGDGAARRNHSRSEEHTSELQSLMRTSYAVF